MLNLLLYAITVAIWGSTWLVITFQISDCAPTVAVAWRFLLACLILLGWCALRRISLRFPARDYALILVQGLANFAFNYWMVYLAEARIPSGLVAVIFTLLLVFNMVGEEVAKLADRSLSAGNYRFNWDGSNSAGSTVGNGVYYFVVVQPSGNTVKKVIVLK